MEKQTILTTLKPKKFPDLEFLVVSLSKENAPEAIDFISREFYHDNLLYQYLDFTYDEVYLQLKFIVEKNIELQIGIVVYETNSKEIAGIFIFEDHYDRANQMDRVGKIIPGFAKKAEIYNANVGKYIRENLYDDFITKPSKSLERISGFTAVSEKYRKSGLAVLMTNYLMNEYSPFKNAKSFVGVYSTYVTYKLALNVGYKHIGQLNFKDWVFPEGYKKPDLDEMRKIRPHLIPGEGFYFAKYEKNQAKPKL